MDELLAKPDKDLDAGIRYLEQYISSLNEALTRLKRAEAAQALVSLKMTRAPGTAPSLRDQAQTALGNSAPSATVRRRREEAAALTDEDEFASGRRRLEEAIALYCVQQP